MHDVCLCAHGLNVHFVLDRLTSLQDHARDECVVPDLMEKPVCGVVTLCSTSNEVRGVCIFLSATCFTSALKTGAAFHPDMGRIEYTVSEPL